MTPSARVRDLTMTDFPAAINLCGVDPVGSVLAAARIVEMPLAPRLGGGTWGAFEGEELVALAWVGANLVPVSPTGRGLEAIAARAIAERRRFSSIVGDSVAVGRVWRALEQAWPRPRQIREQPSMAIDLLPKVRPHPQVRLSRPDEVAAVLPASIAMFTEEYGYSPLVSGGGYAARVRQLVEGKCSYVLMADGPGGPSVQFKAEIGAQALGVAQLQGVWVDPALRGSGLGTKGTAAVVEAVLAGGANTVSLYVNDYNKAARRVYRRVGFEEVGQYTTVVL